MVLLLNMAGSCMVERRRGDIFAADVEALINSVNCVGVMGRGVALQFKEAYPDNFKAYQEACRRKELQPGRMFVFPTGYVANPQYIINFPTKNHWRSKSRLRDIDAGLDALALEIAEREIQSIAFPPLGSGLGGLNWHDVQPRIENMIASLDGVKALIYQPGSEPEQDQQANTITRDNPTLTESIILYLMATCQTARTTTSLIAIHKLMYFMQATDEPTLKLNFEPSHYGPFATNMRHVLKRMEGHFITGYHDESNEPETPLELVPGAAQKAHRYLEEHPATIKRLESVAELVKEFETQQGLELLATTHWIATSELCADEDAIVAGFHSWSPRKREFTKHQIQQALQTLQRQGWLRGFWAAQTPPTH